MSVEAPAVTVAGGWPVVTVAPALVARDIHVWCVSLDGSSESLAAASEVLSSDERERAARFRFDRDRRRFTVARATLRRILGAYVGVTPERLTFQYGEYGKPRLAGRSHPVFNVSHSADCALIAIAHDGVLGVDIEAVRALDDRDALAGSVFSASEIACLRSLPAAERDRAFFVCWTRKEAFVKATGDGLARPLADFDVTVAPWESPRLSIAADPSEAARWMMASLEPLPGFESALVADGDGRRVHCFMAPSDRRPGSLKQLEESV